MIIDMPPFCYYFTLHTPPLILTKWPTTSPPLIGGWKWYASSTAWEQATTTQFYHLSKATSPKSDFLHTSNCSRIHVVFYLLHPSLSLKLFCSLKRKSRISFTICLLDLANFLLCKFPGTYAKPIKVKLVFDLHSGLLIFCNFLDFAISISVCTLVINCCQQMQWLGQLLQTYLFHNLLKNIDMNQHKLRSLIFFFFQNQRFGKLWIVFAELIINTCSCNDCP